MTTNGIIILNGNPIPCDNELCWLADQGLLIMVKRFCPDGTPWENMNRDELCEGLYMDSFPILYKLILTSPYLFVHFHPHQHTFPLTRRVLYTLIRVLHAWLLSILFPIDDTLALYNLNNVFVLCLANFLIYLWFIESVTLVDIGRPLLTWGHNQKSAAVLPYVTVAVWTV